MKNLIKVPMTFAIMMLSISMFGQKVQTIKPFEPNQADGDAIINLLSGMNKAAYNITVSDARGAKATYGALGASDATLRTSKNVSNSEELRPRITRIITSIITTIGKADLDNAAEIQKIAAKYKR